MLSFLKKFEKFMVVSLIIMMAIVLFLSVIELGWIIVKDVMTAPMFLLDIDELLDIFGLFLLVLIGIELLESIKTYLAQKTIHVEVVLIVAMIAISRKVIILDLNKYSSLSLIGIASLIITLAVAYFLVRKIHREKQIELEATDSDSIKKQG